LTIQGHCTDITTDLGIEFLTTRPQDKPFFLMLHQKAPHRNWDPDERNRARFQDQTIPEPDTLWDDYATRPTALPINEQTVARDLTRRDLKLVPPADLKGPALQRWLNVMPMEVTVNGKTLTGKELVQYKYQRYMQDYLACVQGVDDGVGKVLDFLEQNELAKNTIVIYCADNGWYLGDLGVRTQTHKLIHYWKQDAYEMFDIENDPAEQHNFALPRSRSEAAESGREV